MIKINLLPQEFRKDEKHSLVLPDIISPKSLFLFLFLLIIVEAGLFAYTRWLLEPRYEALQDQFISLGPKLKVVRSIKTETSAKQKTLRALSKKMERPFYWTGILNAVARGTVKGVWLNHLVVETREFEIKKDEEKKEAEKEDSSPKKRPRRKRSSKGPEKEKRFVLALKGRVAAMSGETAVMSHLISRLKQQEAMREAAEDIFLERISRGTLGEKQVYDFVVLCLFRREFEPYLRESGRRS